MLRVGIVGCGNIASVHVKAISRLENAELVAIADIDGCKAEKFAREYALSCRVYSCLQEMLREAALDVIHICTPHYQHTPMILEAYQMGIHVFSEKPPVINREQMKALDEAFQLGNVKMGFCFQNRYNRSTAVIKEILASGVMGKALGGRAFVTWKREAEYYDSTWKGRLATEGGGALINQSIHTLDLLLFYLGSPTRIEASIHNHHLQGIIEVEDTVEALLNFSDGRRACFYASTAYVEDAPVILEISCEQGRLVLQDQSVMICRKNQLPEFIDCKEEDGYGKGYWGSGHLKCIRDFYRAVETDTRFANDWLGVRNTVEAMLQIYGR